jgi:hypothetical protein
MRIDSSGNVGIGTSSPTAALSITRDASTSNLLFNRTGAYSGTDFASSIITSYEGNSLTSFLTIRDGANDAGALAFGTQPTGGTVTERMRITSAGNVGIGTVSPTAVLTASGTSSSVFHAINTETPSAGAGAGIISYTDGTPTAADQRLGFYLFGSRGGVNGLYHAAGIQGFSSQAWTAGTAQGSYLKFETTSDGAASRSERMRIDSSGNVLIGTTTSPAGSKELVLGGDYIEGVVAIGTVGATHTITLANGTVQTATLTSATACTFTMPTAIAGKSFILLLKQPAAPGTATTATFTGVKWPAAGAPTITATVGRMDILTFVADGTNWYGSYAQGYTP